VEAAAAVVGASPESDENEDAGEDVVRPIADMPRWMERVESTPERQVCPNTSARTVDVTNSDELVDALEDARPGDRISLAAGRYEGNFVMAASGEQGKPIWMCGPRDAVFDSGGQKNGYGLHITGSYAGTWGMTISNSQKGIVVAGGDFAQIEYVEVHTIGDEAIHFRGHPTDGVVQDFLIHHTGLRRDKFGEGIYIGSAVSNWGEISDSEPDKIDWVSILRNRIWDTTSDSIDLKEGTSGGRVEFNSFDGSSLAGADSWVDVKGNDYVIQGHVGTNSPEDGLQTHNIADLRWGRDNDFRGNTALVSGPGYGFYIHDADKINYQVSCSNTVIVAASGFSNLPCSDPT
jgi:hypothetical protein